MHTYIHLHNLHLHNLGMDIFIFFQICIYITWSDHCYYCYYWVRGSAVHALSGVASTRGWFWARVASTPSAKGNGLVCTRGQGPHLYTRPRASSVHAEWFCCMYTFVLTAVYFVCSRCAGVRYRSLAVLPLCICVLHCVQVVRFITMPFDNV